MIEIAVLSGKGGTGKSSLTAAFASLNKNIVVADCDVDAANMHLILNHKNYAENIYISGHKAVINYEKCTNCQLCLEYCRFGAISLENNQIKISKTSCDGCMLCSRVCPTGAIDMVEQKDSRWFNAKLKNGEFVHARLAPGEDNSGKLVNVVRESARNIADEKESEIILIDGPPGIGCPVISSLTGVDKVVVVTEPSISGLHDLKRVMELINRFKTKVFLIINKFDLNEEYSQRIEDWSNEKKILLMGKIPFDPAFVEAMINAQSIIEWAPESTISKYLNDIWKKIIE